MAGKFIVIEGMDGAGTTTQSRLLVETLEKRGFKVSLSAEPTNSRIGQECRHLLASPIENSHELLASLALCFAADRMQHVHATIAPVLARGEIVVLDRYLLSSLVYQGLHLPTSFVKEINRYAIKPDLVVVIDVDAKLAHERLTKRVTGKDFYEAPATLAKIRSRYLHFAQEELSTTVLIDGQGTISQVHAHVMSIIERLLG